MCIQGRMCIQGYKNEESDVYSGKIFSLKKKNKNLISAKVIKHEGMMKISDFLWDLIGKMLNMFRDFFLLILLAKR